METYLLSTEIIAGEGSVGALARMVERYGRRVVVVTDGYLVETRAVRDALAQLERAGAEVRTVSDVVPEPTAEVVDAICRSLVGASCDFVVAVGGGSVIDAAKAVCIVFTNPGPIARYDGTDVFENKPVPLVAIPTTAGTGSEVSTSLNVTDTVGNAKLSVRHRWNRAAVAILDPSVLAGIPARVAMFPAIDAVTHALEAYVSRTSNAFSDAYAHQALTLFGESFEGFLADTTNLKHAQSMQIGATMAGVAFSWARTGYVHCLARAIGGRIKIAHGHACALALPSVVAFNADHARSRLSEVARLLLPAGPHRSGADADPVAALVGYFQDLAPRFGYSPALSTFGVERGDLPAIAEYATSLRYERHNPRAAAPGELQSLLESFL